MIIACLKLKYICAHAMAVSIWAESFYINNNYTDDKWCFDAEWLT